MTPTTNAMNNAIYQALAIKAFKFCYPTIDLPGAPGSQNALQLDDLAHGMDNLARLQGIDPTDAVRDLLTEAVSTMEMMPIFTPGQP